MRLSRHVFLVRAWAVAVFLAAWTVAPAAGHKHAPELLQLSGDIERVHDPAIIRANGTYYVFSTLFGRPQGPGHIPIRCSEDLHAWRACGFVFVQLPDWALKQIPGTMTAWAPDISFEDGVFRLYYAVSTFGHNDSVIALATNATLDQSSPNYKWIDQGPVIRSHSGQDDWNAIDPNFIRDEHGGEWLAFGSYWSGIKMRRLEARTGKLSTEDTTLYSLAERPRTNGRVDAIEAPFIVRHGRYYYLFVSFDYCCRGAKSTYNVVVGRSRAVTGPYIDESGRPMLEGGGTRLTDSTTEWRGPGHEAALLQKPDDVMLFHAYSAVNGRPFLMISTIAWDHDWPRVASLPGAPLQP